MKWFGLEEPVYRYLLFWVLIVLWAGSALHFIVAYGWNGVRAVVALTFLGTFFGHLTARLT